MSNLPARGCVSCRAVIPHMGNTDADMPVGTLFSAYGNYGSGLFDPPGPSSPRSLQVVICDGCLRELSSAGLVVEETVYRRPAEHTYRPWSPEDEDE